MGDLLIQRDDAPAVFLWQIGSWRYAVEAQGINLDDLLRLVASLRSDYDFSGGIYAGPAIAMTDMARSIHPVAMRNQGQRAAHPEGTRSQEVPTCFKLCGLTLHKRWCISRVERDLAAAWCCISTVLRCGRFDAEPPDTVHLGIWLLDATAIP